MHKLYTCPSCITFTRNEIHIGYSPVWRVLWAYNTREIIGRGRSPR